MQLAIITPPAEEPVTLAEAKAHCRVDFDDDDLLISTLIVAARRVAEAHVKRCLITTEFEMILDHFPSGGGYYNRAIRQQPGGYLGWLPSNAGHIEIPRPPLQSITSIDYLDGSGDLQTLDPATYIVQAAPANGEAILGGRVAPAFGKLWPITLPQLGAVSIRYLAGYGDASAVPAPAKLAMLLSVGLWYQNREAASDTNLAEIPLAAETLLASIGSGGYA